MVWISVLAVLGTLSLYFPWELGIEADPIAPAPPGIEPEWYFLWVFQILRIFPSEIAGIDGRLMVFAGVGLIGVVWTLVPWLDRHADDGRPSKLLQGSGFFLMITAIILTVWAKFFYHHG